MKVCCKRWKHRPSIHWLKHTPAYTHTSLSRKAPTAGIVYRSSPLMVYPLFPVSLQTRISVIQSPLHACSEGSNSAPCPSAGWFMCVCQFRETVEKNTQDLALIWCRWSFWPIAEGFYCSDISHTHTLTVSFVHFRSCCFSLSDVQRCDMSRPPSRRQPRHPQGQPAQKMETFTMINHTCLRNNGINLDCLCLAGARGFGSSAQIFCELGNPTEQNGIWTNPPESV